MSNQSLKQDKDAFAEQEHKEQMELYEEQAAFFQAEKLGINLDDYTSLEDLKAAIAKAEGKE